MSVGCHPQSKQIALNGDIRIEMIQLGPVSLSVEIVQDPASMAKGLMGRQELVDIQGMLFIFPEPQQLAFWMKDTYIPLDIGYFCADGILREIYRLYPHDLNPKISYRQDLLYALEVPQGYFQQAGIQIGDQLQLKK